MSKPVSPLADPFARAHDFAWLHARWREVARACGTRLATVCPHDGYPVLALRTPALRRSHTGGYYFSAGIHGDEPAGVLALLLWARGLGKSLADLPALIFPCLNPWGLMENARRDASGTDLNRLWETSDHPVVAAVKGAIGTRVFDLALTLHEDYDGRGLYLYEPIHPNVDPWGERLLAGAGKLLPLDPRKTIDRRRLTARGLIRRNSSGSKRIPPGPEALWVHYHHSRRTFTFETPSEFAIAARVETQLRLIRQALRLAQ